jgi:hypothetical protein
MNPIKGISQHKEGVGWTVKHVFKLNHQFDSGAEATL